MKNFRIFFKKYTTLSTEKTDAIIEIEAADFKAAYMKVVKMGKKKGMRIAMIAEVTGKSAFPDHL